MIYIVIITALILVCLSPFIGIWIGIRYNEPALDVALYGMVSTIIVGLLVIAVIGLMAANSWI
jgi:hypothetical protein